MIQRIDYDQENDIVYIAFSDQHNSYGDEINDYVILRRDWDDGRITGVTILDFIKWLQSGAAEIPQLPFEIDFNRQILPFCHIQPIN